MNQKELEEALKEYPAKMKTEAAGIQALQKSLVNLQKATQSNQVQDKINLISDSVKGNTDFQAALGKFDENQECNPCFTRIYKQMSQSISVINQLEQDKQNTQRELAQDLLTFQKECQDSVKEVQLKGQQNTGIGFMTQDLLRFQKHKDSFQKLIYYEMRSHAKMFEQYCKLFEDVSTGINTIQEFAGVMQAGGKFQPADLQEYIQLKLRSNMAADLGNQFRGGIQQPRSQSQQRTPMRGLQPGAAGGEASNQGSAQRGRSEAPPEVGRR